MVKLNLVVTDDSGVEYKYNLPLEMVQTSPEPTPEPEPEPEPEPTPEPEPEPEPEPTPPPPAPTSTIPLSWNDARFSSNIVASSTGVPNGGLIQNKSITDTGQTASIVFYGAGTAKNVRVNSREGVRIGGSGNVLIDGCYLESLGQGADHADTIQVYTPGSSGILKISNSTIVSHTVAATAGLFVADGWSGTVDLENVAVISGPYGVRIHPDGAANIEVRFKDVFVVGPFTYDGLWIDARKFRNGQPVSSFTSSDTRNVITLWENVREATIVNGVLVPGNLIPKPF